jgi:PAS domain S-box-containing protein
MSSLESNSGYGQNHNSLVEDKAWADLMKALMNSLPDFIYFKDIYGRFVFVSNTCAIYPGTPVSDMIGKTDFDFLPSEEAEKLVLEDRKVMETGKPVTDKIEKRLCHGSEMWISVTKAPWKNGDGEIIGITGICREVTQRVEREKHVLDMLSIATHDIRDPLISVGSTIRLLVRGAFGSIDESVKSTLSDVSTRIKLLEKIIGEYLCKASLMNVKTPHKEYLDLRQDIIDPLLDEFSSELEEKKIKIDNRLGTVPGNRVTLRANGAWIRIVYRNLIRNAIKYSPSGYIAFGFEDNGDHYRMNVFNSGPPIPEENITRIFEQFDSKNSTGLGLAISRNLILKHGGDMWCENSDKHPNFIFRIPK